MTDDLPFDNSGRPWTIEWRGGDAMTLAQLAAALGRALNAYAAASKQDDFDRSDSSLTIDGTIDFLELAPLVADELAAAGLRLSKDDT